MNTKILHSEKNSTFITMQYLILALFFGLCIFSLSVLVLLATGRYSLEYLISPKNRKLQKRFRQLLNGDTTTAIRLLQRERRANPGRSNNWYLEKCIRDLERDRKTY